MSLSPLSCPLHLLPTEDEPEILLYGFASVLTALFLTFSCWLHTSGFSLFFPLLAFCLLSGIVWDLDFDFLTYSRFTYYNDLLRNTEIF